MDESPPYRLDIEGLDEAAEEVRAGARCSGRPWIGIHFDCCGAYTRIYRNQAGTAYHGVCPRCARPVTLKVGHDGTDARFFVAR